MHLVGESQPTPKKGRLPETEMPKETAKAADKLNEALTDDAAQALATDLFSLGDDTI